MMDNPKHLERGKKGDVFFCMGSDGKHYVFLQIQGKGIKYLDAVDSLAEARDVAVRERD